MSESGSTSDTSIEDDKPQGKSPNKKQRSTSPSGSDSDDKANAKRQKVDKSSSKTSASSTSKESSKKSAKKKETTPDDDELKIDLGNQRFLMVREFRGKALVDIREFYIDNSSGESKPGKKGISLNPAQWRKLVASVSKVEKALDKM